jgi:hypothetical protein
MTGFAALMSGRKLSQMTDEEILEQIKRLGMPLDAQNCGHDMDLLDQILESVATNYEPLLQE